MLQCSTPVLTPSPTERLYCVVPKVFVSLRRTAGPVFGKLDGFTQASIVIASVGLSEALDATNTPELVLALKLNACPTSPGANVAPPWSVPGLPSQISLALPSPGHQLIMPAGGAAHAPAIPAHCENSDVLTGLPEPSSSVAVAVTTVSPVGSGNVNGPKVAVQLPFVVTIREPGGSGLPRKCCPSPNPDGSHVGLEKNSSRNMVFATLSKVPESVTMPPPKEAEVITGKFWGKLASQGSLSVGPAPSRSIPKLGSTTPLSWIELPRIAQVEGPGRLKGPIPVDAWRAMTFPAPGTMPPIRPLVPCSVFIPLRPGVANGAPAIFKPIILPWMIVPDCVCPSMAYTLAPARIRLPGGIPGVAVMPPMVTPETKAILIPMPLPRRIMRVISVLIKL